MWRICIFYTFTTLKCVNSHFGEQTSHHLQNITKIYFNNKYNQICQTRTDRA